MASSLETQNQQSAAAAQSTDSRVETADEFREALSLRLEWNRAYETVTTQMFANRNDVVAMRDLMDRMEVVRHKAVELSRSLMAEADSTQ